MHASATHLMTSICNSYPQHQCCIPTNPTSTLAGPGNTPTACTCLCRHDLLVHSTRTMYVLREHDLPHSDHRPTNMLCVPEAPPLLQAPPLHQQNPRALHHPNRASPCLPSPPLPHVKLLATPHHRLLSHVLRRPGCRMRRSRCLLSFSVSAASQFRTPRTRPGRLRHKLRATLTSRRQRPGASRVHKRS